MLDLLDVRVTVLGHGTKETPTRVRVEASLGVSRSRTRRVRSTRLSLREADFLREGLKQVLLDLAGSVKTASWFPWRGVSVKTSITTKR
jgi:hypothetical protein